MASTVLGWNGSMMPTVSAAMQGPLRLLKVKFGHDRRERRSCAMILPLFRAQDRGSGDKRPINSPQAEISHGYAPPIVSEHAGNAASAGTSEQPDWIDPRRHPHHGGQDMNSVLSGKRVYERVNLICRHLVKKKK